MITFDIETYDPNLEEMGPGVYRKDGHVLGCALKIDENPGEYLPLVGNERPASYASWKRC